LSLAILCLLHRPSITHWLLPLSSGGGWVFLLIVVIALIVYFGAGILYKRAQLGATGDLSV
jgi:hypothetical protein